jgi:hypothetical protein
MDEDIAMTFWEGYEATLDKEAYIKVIVDNIDAVCEAKEDLGEHYRHVLATQLRSYFDDLLEYAYYEHPY